MKLSAAVSVLLVTLAAGIAQPALAQSGSRTLCADIGNRDWCVPMSLSDSANGASTIGLASTGGTGGSGGTDGSVGGAGGDGGSAGLLFGTGGNGGKPGTGGDGGIAGVGGIGGAGGNSAI